ncbi:preprotein translocase subunit Sec61beta [Mesobacillus foraminis]|nr:preprotein translocase subunit Sec61beta [Mesobacillus foraminis]
MIKQLISVLRYFTVPSPHLKFDPKVILIASFSFYVSL